MYLARGGVSGGTVVVAIVHPLLLSLPPRLPTPPITCYEPEQLGNRLVASPSLYVYDRNRSTSHCSWTICETWARPLSRRSCRSLVSRFRSRQTTGSPPTTVDRYGLSTKALNATMAHLCLYSSLMPTNLESGTCSLSRRTRSASCVPSDIQTSSASWMSSRRILLSIS